MQYAANKITLCELVKKDWVNAQFFQPLVNLAIC